MITWNGLRNEDPALFEVSFMTLKILGLNSSLKGMQYIVAAVFQHVKYNIGIANLCSNLASMTGKHVEVIKRAIKKCIHTIRRNCTNDAIKTCIFPNNSNSTFQFLYHLIFFITDKLITHIKVACE